MDFEFTTVPSIICRLGSAARLSEILKTRSWSGDVLIVTDAGIRAAGLIDPVIDDLSRCSRVHVFDAVVADPPEPVVMAAVACAKTLKPGIIIGIGGGSAMDTAKLVAVLCSSDQPLAAMYGVGNIIGPRRVPLILVPTTAGTGSEVTPIAIVTAGADVKQGVVAPQLLPDIAVLDATLTCKCPAKVTAHTGIDAMVHAIEAYTSKLRKNPVSDGLARQALTLLWHNVLPAVDDGGDLNARQNMLLGACLAGQAFANAPVAAVHALAYPIGGIFHVTHGLSNALVLPHVLKFNLAAAGTLYAELASVVGLAPAANQFIDALEAKCAASGIERRLRDVHIPESAISQLAQSAMLQTRLLQNNPRALVEFDALQIYANAW